MGEVFFGDAELFGVSLINTLKNVLERSVINCNAS